MRDSQTYPYHLTAREAGEAAARADARQLIVTHVGALMDPQVSVDEASAAFAGPVEYAAQGRVFAFEGRE